MQQELDKAKAQLEIALVHAHKGDVHPNPDWNWELDVICLDHDIAVLNFAVEQGFTDFNTACEAYYESLL